jgi:hypothetical protein
VKSWLKTSDVQPKVKFANLKKGAREVETLPKKRTEETHAACTEAERPRWRQAKNAVCYPKKGDASVSV